MGTSSANMWFAKHGPVREATSHRANLRLEIHETNHQSRKDGGHKRGQHIPEEVLHRHTLLSENVPTNPLYIDD